MGNYLKHFCFSLLSCLLILNATTAFANPGDPDFSFGFLGVAVDHDDLHDREAVRVIQQADGKFLVVGSWLPWGPQPPGPAGWVLLRRYNSNGSVDVHFGLSGYGVERLYPSVVEVYGSATDVALQPDGKILVAGQDHLSRPTLWRYTTYGELDDKFGQDGIVTLSNSQCLFVTVIAAGGRIILGIFETNTGKGKLIRLNPDGSIDPAFGVAGSVPVTIHLPEHTPLAINYWTGELVVGGSVVSGAELVPALQYFTFNGQYDTNHGPNGIASIPHSAFCFSLSSPYVMKPIGFNSLFFQPDGKIVAGGFVKNYYDGACFTASCYGNSVIRITTNDQLDTTFGSNGLAASCNGRLGFHSPRLEPASNSRTFALLGGSVNAGAPSGFVRYTSNGSQDLSIKDRPFNFLSQTADWKIVTVSTDDNGDIRLKRFLP